MKKRVFKLTKKELDELIRAAQPPPFIYQLVDGPYNQLKAEQAKMMAMHNSRKVWRKLGKKYGFDYETTEPINGKSALYVAAIPLKEKHKDEKKSQPSSKR